MISDTLLLDLIETIIGSSRNTLYEDPAVAALIFRWLPPMAQHTILRLMDVEGPCPFTDIRSWPSDPVGKQLQSRALWRLTQLGILHGQNKEVFLNDHLRRGLAKALVGELVNSEHVEQSNDSWLQMLLFLAGREGVKISPIIVKLLEQAGLMEGRRSITQRGFQFLLSPIHQQAWLLVSELIKQQANPAECISIIASLIWTGKAVGNTSLMTALMHLGFIAQDSVTNMLATAMCTILAQPRPAVGHTSQGQIIVETNFKMYAYPQDDLQPAILALFARIHDHLPGLIYASLTQESVKAALAKGITADQIIAYLTIHAHPVMKRRLQTAASTASEANVQAGLGSNVLPHTVIDQLKLWERDRDRLKSLSGHLYQDFLQANDFEAFVGEAKRINCLLYSHGVKRLAVISREGHVRMKEWVKEHIKH